MNKMNEHLIDALEQIPLNQEEFALKIRINRNTLTNAVQGRSVTRRTKMKIARGLKRPIEELFPV